MTPDQFDKAKQLQREIQHIEAQLASISPRNLSEFEIGAALFGQRSALQPGIPVLHDTINSLVSDSLKAIVQKSVIEELTQLLALKQRQFEAL
jgi:hypothetical protein